MQAKEREQQSAGRIKDREWASHHCIGGNLKRADESVKISICAESVGHNCDHNHVTLLMSRTAYG